MRKRELEPRTTSSKRSLHAIDTPHGRRPVRTALGDDIAFLEPFNEAGQQAKSALLGQMELTELLGRGS
ncbi:MAG: hypothetical protein OER77_11840 [Myxococcales bacterium]|nr:hypothetical protein [Myxococcales bacterium]